VGLVRRNTTQRMLCTQSHDQLGGVDRGTAIGV